jgi:glycerate kinase
MRVLIAFDKFKDSLTARQACELAARALRARHPDWELDLCPLTDGGEGFEEVLGAAVAGARMKLPVSGPLGSLVEAGHTLVSPEKIPPAALALLNLPRGAATGARIALIEMAAASGLALLPPEKRDPWRTTTHGTGQLIRAAAELGATAVVLGIGGSATHDLGLGALSALGFDFRSEAGEKIRPPIPEHWPRITRIEGEIFASIPAIRIACDVTNPLLGPRGAAAVYGPQKGLTAERQPELETATDRLARLLCAHCGRPASLMERPGTGAAGGISFGLLCAAHAELLPGFELVSAWLDLERRMTAADLVLTGEGRFDSSSLNGKGPGAIAARAAALGKRSYIFAGQVNAVAPTGIIASAITRPGTVLAAAMAQAADNLVAAIQTTF